jgi:hypothetical protein
MALISSRERLLEGIVLRSIEGTTWAISNVVVRLLTMSIWDLLASMMGTDP